MPPSVITCSLPLFSCICIFSRPPFSALCFWFDIFFSLLFFLQARPNGDNMFGGDKQTHAASEGSLGKYGCLGSGLPLPRGDQTKAQLWAAEIAFASAAFGDTRHTRTMQVVKKKCGGYGPHRASESRDHGANLQTLARKRCGRCIPAARRDNGPWHYL